MDTALLIIGIVILVFYFISKKVFPLFQLMVAMLKDEQAEEQIHSD